jgi:hypothetical protein
MIHPILLGPKSHEEDRSPIRNLRGVPLAPLTIVLEGLRGEESIAELCRREGIATSMYYG